MIAGPPRHVAVIDIGKTNAKLALVDLAVPAEVYALRRPNRTLTQGPYPHHDIEALWAFILDGLAELNRKQRIDAVSVTTHGATAALVDAKGELVLPVLDYEFDGPDAVRDDYEAMRPPFAETGSPRLPLGLNLGAQLHWLEHAFPRAFAKARAILTYPQFWAHRLSGIAASEATSLGCHTDLWNPHGRDFSSLAHIMGWRGLFPPLRRAHDALGTLLPEVAARTGLDPAVPVACGIHDSNASLLPHLSSRKLPFAVVSTGTWVVAMAVAGRRTVLDPARDTLINVDAFATPVLSARFMGGREFAQIMGETQAAFGDGDIEAALSAPFMLLPSLAQGSGPYPARAGGWHGAEAQGGARFVAASFYLALMTATCLELIGAAGETVVEGPFAANRPYLSMLATATGRRVSGQNGQATGTAIGAALLAVSPRDAPHAASAPALEPDPALLPYARDWWQALDA